jgi:plastocyanin
VRRRALLIPSLLLLVGCGGGYGGGSGGSNQAAGSGNSIQTIQIAEKEYSLTPSTVTLTKAGTYTFKATNNGSTAHALEIEGNGIESKTGHIEPGSTATLQVALKAGSYEMYCPIDGHKQEGMKGDVAVGSAGAGMSTTTTNETTTSRGGGYGY